MDILLQMEGDLPASDTCLEGSPSWMTRDENYGLRDDDGRENPRFT
jgi:hypothetical protein